MSDALQEAQKKIVKNAINQVLCIDDDFVPPYGEIRGEDKAKENFTRELYIGLKEQCECMVDMAQYLDDTAEDDCYRKRFENKDLLVLDWELTKGPSSHEKALHILELAVETDIPFICIYTREPALDAVYDMIVCWFSGYDKDEVKEKGEEWEEAIDNYKEMKQYILDCYDKHGGDTKKLGTILGKDGWKQVQEAKINIDWYLLYVHYKKNSIPSKSLSKAEIIRVEKQSAKIALNINGKLVICFCKDGITAQGGKSITPKKIVEEISSSIVQMPGSIFNIVWLQYKNYFNRCLYRQGRFFQDIDNKTFIYYNQQINDTYEDHIEKGHFESFIKELYRDELFYRLDREGGGIDRGIMDEINRQDKVSNPDDKELLKLNCCYSMNRDYEEGGRLLRFGDLFYTEAEEGKGTYWLCITPHCDCLRPEGKIENNYFFIKGKECNPHSALEKAEKEFYSFIRKDDSYIAVQWDMKLTSVFIPNKSNIIGDSKTVKGWYKNISLEFLYIGSQKENYTQRLANEAFRWGNRVGIEFVHLEEKKETCKKSTIKNKASQEAAVSQEENI